ncbi:MAG: hypothetical protein MK554_14115, partial [Planctomycetes bacterium]|nr:hypothetical protein [Planctomycetota bacterium]
RSVSILDTHTGGVLFSPNDRDRRINVIAYSPGGELLAAGTWDGRVRLLDSRDGRSVFLIDGHDGGITDLAFSPDGKRLVTSCSEGVVRIWNLGGQY